MGYNDDIKLEQRFSSTIKWILGMCFIGQDVVADRQAATDFAVFTVEPFSVGARLRRYHYYLRYPNQFTIRWSRPSGVETEIHKIRKGLVDYILYGFIDSPGKKVIKYFVGDLDVFRAIDPKPIFIGNNDPPDSELAAFRIAQLPPEFIVHQWEREAQWADG